MRLAAPLCHIRLVLAPDGRAELEKLLGWFDAQGTAVELAVLEHFGRAS